MQKPNYSTAINTERRYSWRDLATSEMKVQNQVPVPDLTSKKECNEEYKKTYAAIEIML